MLPAFFAFARLLIPSGSPKNLGAATNFLGGMMRRLREDNKKATDLGWRIEGAIQQAMGRMIALLRTNLVGLLAMNDEDLKGIHLVTQG
jgi:hypothetical protein